MHPLTQDFEIELHHGLWHTDLRTDAEGLLAGEPFACYVGHTHADIARKGSDLTPHPRFAQWDVLGHGCTAPGRGGDERQEVVAPRLGGKRRLQAWLALLG